MRHAHRHPSDRHGDFDAWAPTYDRSALQRLFFDAGSGTTDPGFQQYRFDLEGDVDVELLREAWDAVLARHDVLRARFVADERGAGGALQIVHRAGPGETRGAEVPER